MEFWGVEVKGGTPLEVRVEEDTVIHLSQASLGKSKNKSESVPLYVELDDRKICLGTLSHQNFPQIPFDLVFEKDFLLSHSWKNGSVYFCGYRSPMPEEGYPFLFVENFYIFSLIFFFYCYYYVVLRIR
ncbi:hypothetical protein SLEP1_g49059 [Rubroshorea leprosula]|uniref:Nucleoplasmin-like domain-containing protein n=1 Tax=Rubroshorea leprosula TaxID=152421 RepID=A0AAV5LVR1_9ROSI|nr:hypothetical protein SLEP1_g49059 [Rubroshorea leprosula]